MAAKFKVLGTEFEEDAVLGVVVSGSIGNAWNQKGSWKPWRLAQEAEGLYEEQLYFLLKTEPDAWSAWAKHWVDVIATAGVPLGEAIRYVEHAVAKEAARRWLLTYETRIAKRFADVPLDASRRKLIENELKAALASGSKCALTSPDDKVRWVAGVDGTGAWVKEEDS